VDVRNGTLVSDYYTLQEEVKGLRKQAGETFQLQRKLTELQEQHTKTKALLKVFFNFLLF
jgi:hypothetical protein